MTVQNLTEADMQDRRKARRKMAHRSFTVAITFGALVIFAGLCDADVAKRIGEMSGFLNLYFGGLFSVFVAYMGIGGYENATTISTTVRPASGGVAGAPVVPGGLAVR